MNSGTLMLAEDEHYCFDERAASRPVNFIERYLRHKNDQPFILEPVQRQFIRDVFGWKHRSGERHGRRRFTDVYWESAADSGKSFVLAALGLYSLVADGQREGQIYSLAGTFTQANVVFDMAKGFIARSPQLRRMLDVVHREIRHPRSRSVWQIVSGKGPGAGRKPSMILAEECWQWGGPGGFHDLNDRKIKTAEPILIAASNTPSPDAGFCWSLREKAIDAIAGNGNPALYPIVWKAADDASTDDPAAWRAANPLLGITVSEADVRAKCVEMMKSEDETRDFRQLYLGIVPNKTGAGRWLDLRVFDAACSPVDPDDLIGDPLYAGLDLSLSDDLSACVFVWARPEKFHVRSHFWLPRVAAERYASEDGIPYLEWAAAGHITLVESPTIDSATRRQIANYVKDHAARHTVKCVGYDTYRAEEAVAAIEAARINCVPIRQGFGVSNGCFELDRRLKEGSIVIDPSPVMRFCAENCEVHRDARGNIWPIKPGAKGSYAGKRAAKIDGIAGLVTALTEARKCVFAPAAPKLFRGITLAGR